MTESVQSTYEEATRCPKCGQPGDVRSKKPAGNALPRGTMLHSVYCVTKLCPWYDTVWYVQVNPDGSVPPPNNHRGQKKVYEGFEGHDELAKRIVDGLRAQHEAEKQANTEIRNPRA